MASIIKRKSKYSVVYSYTDENGNKRQKWETFNTHAEAKKRKIQIEYEKESGTLVVAQAKTIRELLEEYVSIYGVNTWALSTYENRQSLISNYINPIIGDIKLSDVNTRMIDKYYLSLLKVKSVTSRNRTPKNEFCSVHIVREVHKILRNAFNQAVKWEMIPKNPCLNATLPKEDHAPRNIWDAETLFKAIELCEDDLLKLALNLAFACSLRVGEMLALTWDCIDIREGSIQSGNAYLFVNKELQRVKIDALEKLNNKGVILTFPAVFARNTTRLVLKEPKTKTSIRKIFIPATVAKMLQERYQLLQEYKELFGDEYTDYNLVFCNPNGRPIESSVITRALNKLIRDNNLPPVVFHSLRHSSITYKLKLNGGDMKSVQGDSGHAQVKMVADVYSHILDDDRRMNAQRFEDAFYKPHPDESKKEEKQDIPKDADSDLIKQLLSNPQLCAILKEALSNSNS